jgi:hypothetical protein
MTGEEWKLQDKIVREDVEGLVGRKVCSDHGC